MDDPYDDYDPFDDDYYDDDGEGPPCPRCDGDGIVNCYCGGDQCFCENHGEKDCPLCYGEGVADPARAEKYLESEREMMAVMRKAWEEAAPLLPLSAIPPLLEGEGPRRRRTRRRNPMSEITIEMLKAELKASIQVNAHGGEVALDAETVECIAEAILASIERLGLGVVPVEPNMAIVKAGQNYIGWHGWKPMVSAVNLVPPVSNNTGESDGTGAG